MPHLELAELTPGDDRLDAALHVLRTLRPDVPMAGMAERFASQHAEGYRLTAAFEGEDCVGAAGWRIFTTFADGRALHVDDLVTGAHARSRGVGGRLLADLEERAAAAGCDRVRLDSGVTRHDAHRFYLRAYYRIHGHHFVKDL